MNLRYACIQLTAVRIANKNRAWCVPCDSWLQTESLFHFVCIKRVKIFTALCALLCHRTHKLLSVHNTIGRHAKIIPLTSFALSNCYTECVVGAQHKHMIVLMEGEYSLYSNPCFSINTLPQHAAPFSYTVHTAWGAARVCDVGSYGSCDIRQLNRECILYFGWWYRQIWTIVAAAVVATTEKIDRKHTFHLVKCMKDTSINTQTHSHTLAHRE